MPDLVRDESLKLLGIEEIERRLRDQQYRTSVQSHGGLGNLDDLDFVNPLASVQLEDAPRGRELLFLGRIELADVTFRRKARQNGLPLGGAHGRRAIGTESRDDSRGVMAREVVESGFQRGCVRGRDGRECREYSGRQPRLPAIPAVTRGRHGPKFGAGRQEVL